MNNTVNMTTAALSSDMSWFSLIILVSFVAVVLSLLVMAMSSVTRYKKLKGALEWLTTTFNYFLMGLATLATLAVPGLVIFFFGKQAAEGNTAPVWMTACIILGYFAISLLGWLSKKFVVDRVKLFEEEIKKEGEDD